MRSGLTVLSVGIVLALIVVDAAHARTLGVSGHTTLGRTTKSVHLGALRPAHNSRGRVVLPSSSAFGDTRSSRGISVLRGGLRIAEGGGSISVKGLVAVRYRDRSVLLAQKRGRGGCFHLSRALSHFRSRRSYPSAVRRVARATKGLCAHRRVFALAKLTRLGGRVHSRGRSELSARLALTSEARRLIAATAPASAPGPATPSPAPAHGSCAPTPPAPTSTELGIFTPLYNGLNTPQDIITEARSVGVGTVRLSQVLGNPIKSAFATFRQAGLKQVLTTVNDPQDDGNGHNPGHPPVTPEEFATFRQRLGSVLDTLRPLSVLEVENEENASNFWAGTMQEYLEELDAAIEVAHARGVKVTNGGITSDPVALMTWQDYMDRGMEAQAMDYARRAFADQPWIIRDLSKRPFTGLSRAGAQAAWDKAKELIPAYATNDMDYVDFHWYHDDPTTLIETVRYLERVTGKPAVTTEIGQHNTDPAVPAGGLPAMIQTLRMPLAVWFDFDGIPARGLHEGFGQLRPNGVAFRDYVKGRTC